LHVANRAYDRTQPFPSRGRLRAEDDAPVPPIVILVTRSTIQIGATSEIPGKSVRTLFALIVNKLRT